MDTKYVYCKNDSQRKYSLVFKWFVACLRDNPSELNISYSRIRCEKTDFILAKVSSWNVSVEENYIRV